MTTIEALRNLTHWHIHHRAVLVCALRRACDCPSMCLDAASERTSTIFLQTYWSVPISVEVIP